MRHNHISILAFVCAFVCAPKAFAWQPQGNHIRTPWAEQVSPTNALPEYPRPIMERSEWQNINGLWDYAIRPASETGTCPTQYDGQILVPFPVESSLSGVGKVVGKDNTLWYHTTFKLPKGWNGRHVLLHFGAVDWQAQVWLNGIKLGTHTGGYAGFSFDITPYLVGGQQELVVRVWDPTTDGYGAVGKQMTNPNGIWYTPVTGIWQTVWMEPVNDQHIDALVATADIDAGTLHIDATVDDPTATYLHATLRDGNTVVAEERVATDQPLDLCVPKAKLWSPESPFLYDLEVELLRAGKVVDHVKSYAAMRKISTKRDEGGVVRMQLNNKDLFQVGPLDQGYWPDGLYTAPTDEALLFDIQKTKDFGFNMIRKHMKVEPARWYTHCDRLGLLVWQDMPMADHDAYPGWNSKTYFDGREDKRSPQSAANFRHEWQDIVAQFKAYPCIVVWTPFNEAWGQFSTAETAQWTKEMDPTRLVNTASGGNHFQAGDILDLHNYPEPKMYLYDANRVTVLGEFGGLGLPIQGHLWQDDKNWGYVQFKGEEEVTDRYVQYMAELEPLIRQGFSAAVYTQTTDVEIEVNGLMTYDRRIVKLTESRIREANQRAAHALDK